MNESKVKVGLHR